MDKYNDTQSHGVKPISFELSENNKYSDAHCSEAGIRLICSWSVVEEAGVPGVLGVMDPAAEVLAENV